MSLLKADGFLRLVAEVRDSNHRKLLRCHYNLDDREKDWKRPESNLLSRGSKKAGTIVMQQQEP